MAAMLRSPVGEPFRNLFIPVFGENLDIPDDADLMNLIPRAAGRGEELKQRIFITCGRQDEENYHVRSQNLIFMESARKAGLDLNYREWDGAHVWNVWDRSLLEFISFVENSRYSEDERKNWTEDAGVLR
jgi:putative lysine transport system ATP-binding protein